MTRLTAALGLAILLGLGPARAQVGPTGLLTADAAAGWEGVGRLDIDGKGFCTGALVAPDLVLTAAHCLFDRDTGGPVDPARILFLAGFRNGRALASRAVRRAVPHPAYVFAADAEASRSREDLALLQLAQPIRSPGITPFEVAGAAHAGASVGVVSYAAGREEAPALERACGVLGEEAGVLVMDCEAEFGASGAPVFLLEGGVARIVSVVSAKGELAGASVSLGSALGEPLLELRAAFAVTGTAALPGVRSLGAGERAETGARFVAVGD